MPSKQTPDKRQRAKKRACGWAQGCDVSARTGVGYEDADARGQTGAGNAGARGQTDMRSKQALLDIVEGEVRESASHCAREREGL